LGEHRISPIYEPPIIKKLYLSSIIQTPNFFIDESEPSDLQCHIYQDLISKARQLLRSADELVIIGYSFPPTDFLIKFLFVDAFKESKLKDLILVNPDDTTIQRSENICRYDGRTLRFKNLSSYLHFQRIESYE
jgi:hypothetical protein